MTDNTNESSSGGISENNANSLASNNNDSGLVPNTVMPANSQTADAPSGNANDVNKTVTASQQPPTPVTDSATPIVQSPLPMMSAAVTPTVLRAPLQPVHLQSVLQSYIAPHLVISSPTPVSVSFAGSTVTSSDTRPATVQAVNALQRAAGSRPAAIQGQVHPFVIGQIGVMPGTALGTARLAGNQTAHIIGTFPSTSQQFTASAGQLVNGGTVIGQFSAMRQLQPGIAIQSPTLLSTQPLYIRTAGPGQQHVIPVMPSSVHSVESQTVLPIKPTGTKQIKAAPGSSPIKGGQGVHHVVQRVAVTGVTNIVSTPGSANATKPVTKLRPIKPAGIAVKRNPTTLTSPALSKTGPAVAVVQSSTEVVPSATQVKAMTGMQTATKFVVSGSASDRLGLSAPIDMATAVKATLCSPTAAPTVVPVPMATEDTVASIKTGVDSAKQKAVVKPQPQILTHVIDGFVILEGTEPFPVQRSSLKATLANAKAAAADHQVDELAKTGVNGQQGSGKEDMRPLTCEFCGKVDSAYRFKESKRFCSMACAKQYNANSARLKLPAKVASRKKTGDELNASRDSSTPADDVSEHTSESSEMQDVVMRSGTGTPLEAVPGAVSPPEHGSVGGSIESGLEDMDQSLHRKPVRQWTVDDVLDMIRSLPGCDMYVGEFSRQEIDGQALMLLKEDHMMRTMNIKLGPALKICAHVASLLQTDS